MAEAWFDGLPRTGNASADVTRFRFAKNTSTAAEDLLVAHAGEGDLVLGITADTVETGSPVNVYTSGVGRLSVANASAIPVSTPIACGANGIGVAATEGDEYNAILLDPVAERDSPEDPPAIVRVVITRGLVPVIPD